MRAALLAAGFLLLAAGSDAAAATPKFVGPCFTVHGRLRGGNGTPTLRIWPVGTTRLLGVDNDNDDPLEDIGELPASLQALGPIFLDRDIYGDFTVCPLTRSRPGWMQMVAIKQARRLHVVERR